MDPAKELGRLELPFPVPPPLQPLPLPNLEARDRNEGVKCSFKVFLCFKTKVGGVEGAPRYWSQLLKFIVRDRSRDICRAGRLTGRLLDDSFSWALFLPFVERVSDRQIPNALEVSLDNKAGAAKRLRDFALATADSNDSVEKEELWEAFTGWDECRQRLVVLAAPGVMAKEAVPRRRASRCCSS